jgi:hypothetical protein
MDTDDPRLARLLAIQRHARDQYQRLTKPSDFPADPEIVAIAKKLWDEATAAVNDRLAENSE